MKRALGRPTGRFTQHRRIDRLRDILEKHPRGLSIYELADALEVTPRTMRRYLKEVERDYNLEPTETRGGGPLLWRIRAGELPRKIDLRRTQAYALLAARRIFEPMRGSTLFEEIDLAIGKLMALAHRPGRGPNAGLADARIEERFLYLPFAPKNYAEKTNELDDLFQAVTDLRPLTLRYRSAARAEEELITIHPYAMVLHRDSIYCVGFHVGRGEIRTFVLDRMRDTQHSATERFQLPKDFSVADYFQGELGVWRSRERHRVVVEFDEHAAEYVRMRRVHATQKLASIAGGGVRLTMTVGDLNQVASWVLEWGKRARVVEPPELVERVRSELADALALYRGAPPARRAPERTRAGVSASPPAGSRRGRTDTK
ncbi:MAG: WYL domain-containing transcriptional regulator [Sorangiineae bacterium]|nr:WYL domain-containing transcriptional regulator [Polyangiaceae bacterium]MEB2320931.1 WYL domain-containing transcriptional regulator [Sorangiineae bacterium]